MPISQQIGSSSLAKPGVCTSTTRPASPYDGMVIYETDTDRTLVWNGSAWVYLSTSTANPVGLELVKTQTIGSGVPSVTVSDAFSANYDNYRILISGGSSSVNTNLTMTLGATATGYAQIGIYSQLTVGTVLTYNDANTTGWASVGYCSANGLYGNIEIHDPYNAKWTVFDSVCMQPVAAGYINRASGFLANTTSYTAFTLTLGAGTMTGGTIRVYGYKN